MSHKIEDKNAFPQGWIKAKLGEVCEVLDSKRVPINSDERAKRIIGKSKTELFPYYGATGLVGYIDDFLFDGEYVLLGEDGAPFLESFKDKAYLAKGKFWVNNHAHILEALFSKTYLCHYLNQINYREFVTGTTRLKLNQASMKEIPIILPPLPEQHRIVAKIEELFSELDKGAEALKTAQQQLKIYRQAVLKWAFEGKLTEEWRKSNNYTTKDTIDLKSKIESFNRNKEGQDIPGRLAPMDYNDLSGLPFGWLWIEAHKICQSVRDGTHDTPKYVNKGIPLITSKNLVNGTLDFTKIDYISEDDHREIHKRSGVENGDILFGMIGTIGNPVIVDTNIIFSIKNVGLFKRNERLIISKYLKYWLESSYCENILKKKELIKGTTQKFIALGGLRVLPTPLPSLDEQNEIIAEIETRLSVADKLEEAITQSLQQAEALRQSILKKAFAGKLVAQDPNDEPAAKLLERIKAEKATQGPIKRSK